MHHFERIHTVIIGAGQAGLAVGYYLSQRGVPFVILDEQARVGDSWRQRWDSLRLFTPARYDALPGLSFPGSKNYFPTKGEMADYLEQYRDRFDLPVRAGVRVEQVTRSNSNFVVATRDQLYVADNVVIAMSNFQRPRIPESARALDPKILQLHSAGYRNVSQLRPGGVLVAGAGNSGAEIARETARAGFATWIAGRDVGSLPYRIDGPAARLLAPLLLRFIFHRVLTTNTPMGRRVRQAALRRGAPLLRTKPKELSALGVRRVPRFTGVREGRPLVGDTRVLDVTNVIWCTGFEPSFSWIDLPIFASDGQPMQQRGVVASEPGLYFVGLHFLHAMSSAMIHGVSRDAEYVANKISARVPAVDQPSRVLAAPIRFAVS